MPAADDLDLLIDAARAAGDLALTFDGTRAERWDKPANEGPVTEADIAVNTLLEERLRGARPGYGWLSEESPDTTERLEAERVFVIDPIDGTRSFIDGSGSWAHSIALVEAGEVVAGVVYLPARAKLYAAVRGGGATLNGAPLRASAAATIEGAEVLATRPNMEPGLWPGGVPELKRSHRPSVAYRLALVAEGRFDGMLTFRDSWEWDIAAGAILVAEAGARISDGQGHPLRFNNARPKLPGLIAAGAAVHADLLRARGVPER